MDEVEKTIVDDIEPPESRVPTKPLPRTLMASRVVCEFSGGDGEDVAAFFEMLAKIIRTKKRITVICE